MEETHKANIASLVSTHHDTCATHERNFAALLEREGQAKAQQRAAEATSAELAAEVKFLKSAIASLRAERQVLHHDHDENTGQLESSIASLRAERQVLLDDHNEKTGQLESTVSKYLSQRDAEAAKAEEKEYDLRRLTAAHDALNKRFNAFQTDVERKDDDFRRLTSEKDDLNKQVDNYRDQHAEALAFVRTAQKDVAAAQEKANSRGQRLQLFHVRTKPKAFTC